MTRFLVILSLILFYFVLGWITPTIFNPIFFPNPFDVILSLKSMFENGMILNGLLYSFSRITIATLLAICISTPIGIIAGVNPKIEKLITPITGSFRYIPVTALFPLLIMWFGIGEEMKIMFLFIAVFFFFLPTVLNEVKNVDQDLIETAYTMGMNKFQTILHVICPAIMPTLCQSFITMYGIGWTYVIIAEVINAQQGIGFLLNIAAARGRTDIVFGVLLIVILFSYIFDTLGNKIIKYKFSWKFLKQVKD